MAATISIPGISTELNSFLSGINSDEEDNVKVALKSVIDADVGKALDLLAEYLQWSPEAAELFQVTSNFKAGPIPTLTTQVFARIAQVPPRSDQLRTSILLAVRKYFKLKSKNLKANLAEGEAHVGRVKAALSFLRGMVSLAPSHAREVLKVIQLEPSLYASLSQAHKANDAKDKKKKKKVKAIKLAGPSTTRYHLVRLVSVLLSVRDPGVLIGVIEQDGLLSSIINGIAMDVPESLTEFLLALRGLFLNHDIMLKQKIHLLDNNYADGFLRLLSATSSCLENKEEGEDQDEDEEEEDLKARHDVAIEFLLDLLCHCQILRPLDTQQCSRMAAKYMKSLKNLEDDAVRGLMEELSTTYPEAVAAYYRKVPFSLEPRLSKKCLQNFEFLAQLMNRSCNALVDSDRSLPAEEVVVDLIVPPCLRKSILTKALQHTSTWLQRSALRCLRTSLRTIQDLVKRPDVVDEWGSIRDAVVKRVPDMNVVLSLYSLSPNQGKSSENGKNEPHFNNGDFGSCPDHWGIVIDALEVIALYGDVAPALLRGIRLDASSFRFLLAELFTQQVAVQRAATAVVVAAPQLCAPALSNSGQMKLPSFLSLLFASIAELRTRSHKSNEESHLEELQSRCAGIVLGYFSGVRSRGMAKVFEEEWLWLLCPKTLSLFEQSLNNAVKPRNSGSPAHTGCWWSRLTEHLALAVEKTKDVECLLFFLHGFIHLATKEFVLRLAQGLDEGTRLRFVIRSLSLLLSSLPEEQFSWLKARFEILGRVFEQMQSNASHIDNSEDCFHQLLSIIENEGEKKFASGLRSSTHGIGMTFCWLVKEDLFHTDSMANKDRLACQHVSGLETILIGDSALNRVHHDVLFASTWYLGSPAIGMDGAVLSYVKKMLKDRIMAAQPAELAVLCTLLIGTVSSLSKQDVTHDRCAILNTALFNVLQQPPLDCFDALVERTVTAFEENGRWLDGLIASNSLDIFSSLCKSMDYGARAARSMLTGLCRSAEGMTDGQVSAVLNAVNGKSVEPDVLSEVLRTFLTRSHDTRFASICFLLLRQTSARILINCNAMSSEYLVELLGKENAQASEMIVLLASRSIAVSMSLINKIRDGELDVRSERGLLLAATAFACVLTGGNAETATVHQYKIRSEAQDLARAAIVKVLLPQADDVTPGDSCLEAVARLLDGLPKDTITGSVVEELLLHLPYTLQSVLKSGTTEGHLSLLLAALGNDSILKERRADALEVGFGAVVSTLRFVNAGSPSQKLALRLGHALITACGLNDTVPSIRKENANEWTDSASVERMCKFLRHCIKARIEDSEEVALGEALVHTLYTKDWRTVAESIVGKPSSVLRALFVNKDSIARNLLKEKSLVGCSLAKIASKFIELADDEVAVGKTTLLLSSCYSATVSAFDQAIRKSLESGRYRLHQLRRERAEASEVFETSWIPLSMHPSEVGVRWGQAVPVEDDDWVTTVSLASSTADKTYSWFFDLAVNKHTIQSSIRYMADNPSIYGVIDVDRKSNFDPVCESDLFVNVVDRVFGNNTSDNVEEMADSTLVGEQSHINDRSMSDNKSGGPENNDGTKMDMDSEMSSEDEEDDAVDVDEDEQENESESAEVREGSEKTPTATHDGREGSSEVDPLDLHSADRTSAKKRSRFSFADYKNVESLFEDYGVISRANTSAHELVYDTEVLLTIALQMFDQGGNRDIIRLYKDGILGLAITAMTVEHKPSRVLGYGIVGKFFEFVTSTELRERLQIQLILASLKNGIKEPFERIPRIIAHFVTEGLQILSRPHHDMFAAFNRFLLQRPSLELSDIPLFYSMFHSSSYKSRSDLIWMLRQMASSVKSDADVVILERRHAVEMILGLLADAEGTRMKGAGEGSSLVPSVDVSAKVVDEESTERTAQRQTEDEAVTAGRSGGPEGLRTWEEWSFRVLHCVASTWKGAQVLFSRGFPSWVLAFCSARLPAVVSGSDGDVSLISGAVRALDALSFWLRSKQLRQFSLPLHVSAARLLHNLSECAMELDNSSAPQRSRRSKEEGARRKAVVKEWVESVVRVYLQCQRCLASGQKKMREDQVVRESIRSLERNAMVTSIAACYLREISLWTQVGSLPVHQSQVSESMETELIEALALTPSDCRTPFLPTIFEDRSAALASSKHGGWLVNTGRIEIALETVAYLARDPRRRHIVAAAITSLVSKNGLAQSTSTCLAEDELLLIYITKMVIELFLRASSVAQAKLTEMDSVHDDKELILYLLGSELRLYSDSVLVAPTGDEAGFASLAADAIDCVTSQDSPPSSLTFFLTSEKWQKLKELLSMRESKRAAPGAKAKQTTPIASATPSKKRQPSSQTTPLSTGKRRKRRV